uniref:uncharacterized protein n=1 Tax=Myxine glutinosa TaxID=7769 RepID=UPI00358EF00E
MNNQQTYVSAKTSENSAEEATPKEEGESDLFDRCDVTESALHTKKEEMQNVTLGQPKDEDMFCRPKSPVSQAMDESPLGKLLGHSYVSRFQDEVTDGVKTQAQMTSDSQDIFSVSPTPRLSEICSGESQALGCDSEPNLTPRSGMIRSFVPCPVCSFVASGGFTELSQHLADTHAEAFPLKCEFCLRVFRTIPELVAHRTSAHALPDHLLPCPKCPATFAFKENLKAHVSQIHESLNLGEVGNANLTDVSNERSDRVQSWIRSLKRATIGEECSVDSPNLISHKAKTIDDNDDGLHNNSTSMKNISSHLMLDMPTSKSPEKLDNLSTCSASCDSTMRPLEMPSLEKEIDFSQDSGNFTKVNMDSQWKFLESQQDFGLSTLTMVKNFEAEFPKIEPNTITAVELCKPSLSYNDDASSKEIGEANQTSNDIVSTSPLVLPSASRLVLRPQNFTDSSQTHLYSSLVEEPDEGEKKAPVTRLRALLSGTHPIPPGVHILGDVNAARYPTYRPAPFRYRKPGRGASTATMVTGQLIPTGRIPERFEVPCRCPQCGELHTQLTSLREHAIVCGRERRRMAGLRTTLSCSIGKPASKEQQYASVADGLGNTAANKWRGPSIRQQRSPDAKLTSQEQWEKLPSIIDAATTKTTSPLIPRKRSSLGSQGARLAKEAKLQDKHPSSGSPLSSSKLERKWAKIAANDRAVGGKLNEVYSPIARYSKPTLAPNHKVARPYEQLSIERKKAVSPAFVEKRSPGLASLKQSGAQNTPPPKPSPVPRSSPTHACPRCGRGFTYLGSLSKHVALCLSGQSGRKRGPKKDKAGPGSSKKIKSRSM